MSEELQPEKNHGLDEIVDDQEDSEEEGGIYYACRNCGGRHPHGEPRSCKEESDEK